MKINGKNLTIDDVWKVAHSLEQVSLDVTAKKNMDAARKFIENKIDNGEVIYGVNTGFGILSDVQIDEKKLADLQRNLIRSHSSGIGKPFSKEESRAIMLLRANALSRGHSGVRSHVVEKILEFLNKDIIPVIPSQGSVGASGDLAPLSHLALAIIGEGEVWSGEKCVSAGSVLKKHGVKPLELKAKEGLAMINGCQVMTAVGLLALHRARELCWIADLSGGMSLEALKGARSAFNPLISSVRPHTGEIHTAKNILKLIGETSEIGESHEDCKRVQDAYSLRCMPQVHGAAKDAIRRAIEVLEIEANSSTDNPLVFYKENLVLSCGNFHGMPVAFQMDFASIAMTALSSIAERRLEKLGNPQYSQFPIFLAPDPGLNSGHMIVQYAGAALVSENKTLAHPASVDSIPTNANKEDHVSMGTIAARKFSQIVDNVENVIAMELLSGCQALDFLKPLGPSSAVLAVYQRVRKDIGFASVDRIFSKDVNHIRELIRKGEVLKAIHKACGQLDL